MKKVELRKKVDSLIKHNTIGSFRINSTNCVNSKWVAFWLAKPKQEYCECGFECKIKVSRRNYDYVITKKELIKLIEQDEVRNVGQHRTLLETLNFD